MDDDSLRAVIERQLVVENSGPLVERARRVTARLQQAIPEPDRLAITVIASTRHGAFTAPGKTIYVSTRLLERLHDDEATAFVIAHELSHHRLGHVPEGGPLWSRLPVRVALALVAKAIAGPRRGRDADLLAIEMCVDAGYDPERCALALEILDQVFIEYGDESGTLGPADGASRWWWSRGRGDFSMGERIAALRAHVKGMRHGARVVVDPHATRERRRRRVVIAATAGALGLALLLVRPR